MTPQIKQRIDQIRRGEVPEGYKKTKAGVIPSEWELHPLSKHLTESRIPGTNGAVAKKLTVKLWNKGVFEKREVHEGSESTTYYKRKAGQLIYSKLDFLNCAFGIIPDHLNGYESTQDLPCFDINDVDPYYLLAYVTQRNFYTHFGMIADGGRKARRVGPEDMLSFPLIYPSLPEQEKIAEILAAQDKLIALKEKLIEEKKRQKNSIADKLFSPEYIKQKSPLANKTSFAQICSVVTDYVSNGSFKSLKDNVEYLEQGYAVLLRLADYNNGFDKNKFIYVNEKAFNFLSRSIVYPNDIIIANVGSVGAVFRAPDLKVPMSLAPNTILVRTNISNDYFYHFVCSTRGQELLKTITSTTAQPKFNKTDFKSLEMYVPNEDAQRNTSQILNLVDKEIEILKKDLGQEKQKKKALMQLLLTGIVRV